MKKKNYYFQSEVKQLLDLMINSLYSNKEIFLRELISNSSDAIDKLKFYYLTSNIDNNLNSNYYIRIFIDNNILNISDNGIGMTKKEVIENLGTIAKSGTKEFLKNISTKDKKFISNDIIGQFGVGFYSSFIVSDKVVVHTRSIEESDKNKSILWISKGKGKYTISNEFKENVGTDIKLYIKDSCKEFLDENRIKNIIKKYSNHINVPIENRIFSNKKKKFIWVKINQSEALWLKNKFNISDKEYKNFYLSLTNNLGNALIWSHNKVEGKNEYISLLYISDTSPWNIWNRDEYKNGIKLYINRIFIMEGIKKIIPFYLRFVQGIVDTNNLSLNISREILQDTEEISKLCISLTNRVLKILNNLSLNKDKYIIFWKNFGNIFKEGLAEDEVNVFKISLLLRFNSTFSKDKDDYISLEDYLKRMKIGQEKIFYIITDNYLSSLSSPHLEFYRNRNIEVLLMFDRIDEWMMTYLVDFKGIKFQSINKKYVENNNIITFDKKNNILNLNKDKYLNLINRIKNVLKDEVKDVVITDKLNNFPVVVSTDNNEMSTQMLKLLTFAGKKFPKIKYLFEININHLLIKYINNIKDEVIFNQWVKFLYFQALLIESNSLENSVDFINLANNLLLSMIIK